MNNDTCVCCGQYVPEGRQVCQSCQNSSRENALKKTRGKVFNENVLQQRVSIEQETKPPLKTKSNI